MSSSWAYYAQCNVVSIGTIRIKTHNGLSRTFSTVCHIPNLNHNLMSLHNIESNGWKYSAEGGVLKISKGALVLTKGERNKTLYIVPGFPWLILLHSPPRHQNRPYSIAACSLGQHKWERNDNSKQGLLYSEVTGKLDFCDHCALGKQKRVSFSIARHLLKVPLITFILIYGSI